MSAAIANAVDDNIAGQARADETLRRIRDGSSHPDELYTAMLKVWGEGGNPKLLGFCRRVQKTLERASA